MSPEQLRIRPDNGTVRELNIPKEILEYLEKISILSRQNRPVQKVTDKETHEGLSLLYLP